MNWGEFFDGAVLFVQQAWYWVALGFMLAGYFVYALTLKWRPSRRGG